MITITDLQCPLCGTSDPEIVEEYPDSEQAGLHPLDSVCCHDCGHQGNAGAFISID